MSEGDATERRSIAVTAGGTGPPASERQRGSGARPRVAYLSYNSTAEYDARTFRMARSAIDAGWEVTVYARWHRGSPAIEQRDGFRLVRAPNQWRYLVPGLRRRARRRYRAALARTASPVSPGTALNESGRSRRPLRFRFRPLERWHWWQRIREFPLQPMGWAIALDDVAEPADIWHGMWAGSLPALDRLRSRQGGRTIYDSRDIFMHSRKFARLGRPGRSLLEWAERRWARRADRVLTVNEPYADLIEEKLHVRRPPIVMNNPATWTPPTPPPDLIREALGLSAETAIVLYQGILTFERGIEQSMEAILAVPSAVLVLMGFGPLADEYTEAASRPPYLGRVLVLPAVPPDHLLPWTASADVSVIAYQPTTLNHQYTTPQKLFESFAAGVPVVAADMPGMAPIVRATEAGLLCDPTSPASIAEAITTIVTAPAAERLALRERALRAAHERYNWEAQVGTLFSLYRELLPTGVDAPAVNDQERIADLEAQVERLERDLAQMQRLRRDDFAARTLQADRLRKTREKLQRLEGRRTVRLALGLSNLMQPFRPVIRRLVAVPRRLTRMIRSRGGGRGRPDGVRRTPRAELELGAAIRNDLVPATVAHGPLVSIIILNRDRRGLLEQCLAALARTTYVDVEVVVVDNGSTDGSAEMAEGLSLPFPLRVIRNEENRSFSDANDQAVAVVRGELLCFLNNDVEPITDDWLGYMVETLMTTDAVAVGARLVYPASRGRKRGGAHHDDLTLQHRGVAFDRTEAVPLPVALGAGENPRAADAIAIEDRPALTAACLLVRKAAFDAVGGFGSGYDYGLEDIDLCLTLRAAGGRLVYDGRAALWHHESATRIADRAEQRRRRKANREAYYDDWGPRIFREALLDALDGGDRYSSAPFHVAIVGAPEAGLDEALTALGWRVSRPSPDAKAALDLDPSVEAILVADDAIDIRTLPARLISLAWVRADPAEWVVRPWFDDYDIVLAAEATSRALVRERTSKTATAVPTEPTAGSIRDALATWATATRYGIRIGAESRDVAEHWGDYHFARALQRSLERSGHPTRVHLLPDWVKPIAAREDVALHLFGFKEAPTRPSQVNLLWHISHPDLASPELYERYDHAFVASDRFAARMAAQTSTPVSSLHQATDPERFRPDPTGPAFDLLFVGNSRGTRRRIVDDVVATGHDIAVFGSLWRPALLDPRFLKGENIPNADLNRYYSSAAIVLNDHWNDMVAEGFIANRLYDALACGAFVISDHLPELAAEFDDAVVSYADRDELGALIDRYLADPDERRARGARGRAAVVSRHTFDERAAVIRETVDSLLPMVRSR